MSILATTKALKSQYINILGFSILPVATVSLTGLGFQRFSQGAHLLIAICHVRKPFSPKVFIPPPLGILGEFEHIKRLNKRTLKCLSVIVGEQN